VPRSGEIKSDHRTVHIWNCWMLRVSEAAQLFKGDEWLSSGHGSINLHEHLVTTGMRRHALRCEERGVRSAELEVVSGEWRVGSGEWGAWE
jgi:hypothetical protein